MTSTEKRLLEFAELVKEFCLAANPIIESALHDAMQDKCVEIIEEFSEKEKNDGRKKKTE